MILILFNYYNELIYSKDITNKYGWNIAFEYGKVDTIEWFLKYSNKKLNDFVEDCKGIFK